MELLLNIVVFVISVIYIIYSYVRITKRLKINNSEIRYFFKTGQPADFIQLYLLAIISFAVIYWLAADSNTLKGFKEYSWVDAYYFSTVTVTTLGFGDIYPIEPIGKFLVSIQVVFGVMTFGLFLNAVSREHTNEVIKNENRIEEERKQELRKSLEKHVCLLMDIFQQGWVYGAARNVKYARSINELSPFMKGVHQGGKGGLLHETWSTEDHVKHITLLLQAADNQHPNLVSLTPIASEISADHLIIWCSLLTTVSNLRSLHKTYISEWNNRSPLQQYELLLDQAGPQIEELIEYSFFLCNIEFEPLTDFPISLNPEDEAQ